GFDITVASEAMAIFCLAATVHELKRRLGNIIVAQNRAREPVRASELKAAGSMAVLLNDALAPNLVQTLENSPAFIHGGPFANIAHGCNSVVATTTALKLADYVVTEAGFGADLGAEKFFDIKCRKAGLRPAAAVVVATVRALKMHGGVPRDGLKEENVAAVEKGFANLQRHLENLRGFGVHAVVSVNRFSADTEAELGRLQVLCAKEGVEAVVAYHCARDGEGADARARREQYRSGRGRPYHRAVLICMEGAEVKVWRRAERERLIALRQGLPAAQRHNWSAQIDAALRGILAKRPGILGVYWPFRAEFDPRPLVDWAVA